MFVFVLELSKENYLECVAAYFMVIVCKVKKLLVLLSLDLWVFSIKMSSCPLLLLCFFLALVYTLIP